MNESHRIKTIWIASGNPSKANELDYFTQKLLTQFSSTSVRGPKDVVESEKTFLGNARLKSHALAKELVAEGHKNFAVLGDDSGLCVDLLDGRPGIYSARYAGPNAKPKENVDAVLQELNSITTNLDKRTASYQCALSLLLVEDEKTSTEYVAEGSRDGLIALERQGENGYAYDPVFLDPHTLFSYGDISYEDKQSDSHRYRAFVNLRETLSEGVRP